MTTTTEKLQALAASLRAMHAAKIRAMTPHGEQQRYSITGTGERMEDLLAAAKIIDVRQQASLLHPMRADPESIRARIHTWPPSERLELFGDLLPPGLHLSAVELIHDAALRSLEHVQHYSDFDARHDAIKDLLARLGMAL